MSDAYVESIIVLHALAVHANSCACAMLQTSRQLTASCRCQMVGPVLAKPPKALPEDLAAFLDSGADKGLGAVYVSAGEERQQLPGLPLSRRS